MVLRLVGGAFLQQGSKSRCADEFSAFVGDLDNPDAQSPARIYIFCLDSNYPFTYGTQMICVDLNANGRDLCQIGPRDGADGCSGFTKIKRDAAVHYAYVLQHFWRDLHRQDNTLARCLDDLDAEEFH